MRRTVVGMVMAGLLGLVACQPPPPAPVLLVDALGTTGDANPGDGVCSTTGGDGGACTLTAAVEEGNALGRAVVEVPYAVYTDDPYVETSPLTATVTGQLVIRGTGAPANHIAAVSTLDLVVAPGASLELDGIGAAADSHLLVEGTLIARRSWFYVLSDPIAVTTTGTAVLTDSGIWSISGGPLVANDGALVARGAMFNIHYGSAPLISTAPGASTTLGGTWLEQRDAGPACAGPATSAGYNASTDATCGLTGPGDQPGSITPAQAFHPRDPTEPQVDVIPPGVLGCTPGALDLLGLPRAADADGDGIAQCDIGAWELPAP